MKADLERQLERAAWEGEVPAARRSFYILRELLLVWCWTSVPTSWRGRQRALLAQGKTLQTMAVKGEL